MARIPTAANISGPASLRPTGAVSVGDTSAIAEGAAALAAGVARAGQGIGNRDRIIKNRERVSDVSKADAQWLQGSLDISSQFEQDGDYKTFEERSTALSTALKNTAAAAIRDPETRQAWLDAVELKRISLVAAVKEKGTNLSHEADRVALDDSLTSLGQIISEPSTPAVVRDQARQSMEASISLGLNSGLLSPADAQKFRQGHVDAAEERLAINRANLGITINPAKVYADMAIPTDASGAGVVAAATAANGGALPELDFSLAKITADLLGDANFPDDPKLAKAYLSDPEKAADYAEAAVAMLSDRYKGDLTAAVIALDPNGGTALADAFVKGGRDESVLPADVRTRTRATLSNYQRPVSGERIPIEAAPGVDLSNVDVNVLTRFEQLQSAYGEALPLLSGYRDSEHNKAVGGADRSQHLDGRALDVDVSKLSKEDRAKLIEMASSMGFTGIGVYANSIHLDTGPLRAWGPDYHSGSVPAWAKAAIDAHVSGTVSDLPTVYSGVAPEYSKLTFDQRLTIANKAKQAMGERDVAMRSSLETIATNAPAAIANSGVYDGDMPTATDFVQAWGAEDGIQKFKAFDASVDVAKQTYGFRTASNEDILAAVKAAAPVSTGNDAALETKRFDVISTAAQQVLDAREKDPAGYAMSVFPQVQTAFEDANKDPSKFGEALSAMATAQEKLGIDKPMLLPKQMAADAAAKFNDATLPAQERIGALAGLVLQTQDEGQQQAIYQQLVDAGVPAMTQGAVAAMARGDTGAAQTLMRAVMIDPTKMTGKFTDEATTKNINEAMQRIFDDGAIGDIVYGISDGSPESLDRLSGDMTLMSRAVQLRMIDGSANGDINRAVDLTVKDMFGDVQTVTGQNVKITLPKGQDPAPMRDGFKALQPQVRDALRTDMIGGDMSQFPVESGMRAIIGVGIDNAVDMVMSEGYFTNAGDGKFQFINPYTGAAIGGPDGQPLIFSADEVLARGKAAPSQNVWQRAANDRPVSAW